MPAHQPADATVDALRRLIEQHFRKQRLIGFYAEKLAMTPDRLNDHLKRTLGVTAGHLIRQRVLTEAKHELVFTTQPIQRHLRRARLLRSIPFRPFLPQADRHDAAGISRARGRVIRHFGVPLRTVISAIVDPMIEPRACGGD